MSRVGVKLNCGISFLYMACSNIGGVFRYVCQSGGRVWPYIYILIMSDCQIGQIVYCEKIPVFTKSHLNSKSAMDFFLKSLQEMKQK